jgi:predicted GNAT superfamily acetyltransferase
MVTIRDLASLDDYAACVDLQEETWGAGFSERVPTAILRVSQMIGGVSAGAFDGSGDLVGFVFGMTGLRDGELVHWSDMLAVRERLRAQGIGARLKQYQREKVVALGVRSMLWTFDPLQARNAHFNINILGAVPISYQPDMYGSNTGSSLHGALPTDRFVVKWDLRREQAHRPGDDVVRDDDAQLPMANPLDADGRPFVSFLEMTPPPREPGYRVGIPSDLGAVQATSADAARRWRTVVRGVMTTLLSHGYAVSGFRRPAGGAPYYVVRRLTATPIP